MSAVALLSHIQNGAAKSDFKMYVVTVVVVKRYATTDFLFDVKYTF